MSKQTTIRLLIILPIIIILILLMMLIDFNRVVDNMEPLFRVTKAE